jgi:hypothetical protein
VQKKMMLPSLHCWGWRRVDPDPNVVIQNPLRTGSVTTLVCFIMYCSYLGGCCAYRLFARCPISSLGSRFTAVAAASIGHLSLHKK